jgi:hypothetical protein|tara:strand:+ start:4529 stop:4762 length:234 start_codon:yes stop_codon:yes gene_type:complete
MLNKNLPHNQTNKSLQITFCGKGSCKCPSIDINKDNDTVILGGNEEGYTRFTKEQFEMFINEAKNGTFDNYMEDNVE